MKIKILTMNSVCFSKVMIFMQNTSYLKQNSAYKKSGTGTCPFRFLS